MQFDARRHTTARTKTKAGLLTSRAVDGDFISIILPAEVEGYSYPPHVLPHLIIALVRKIRNRTDRGNTQPESHSCFHLSLSDKVAVRVDIVKSKVRERNVETFCLLLHD